MEHECVWLAASVSRLNRGLSNSCDQLENDKDTFLDVLGRFKLGQPVNKAELPRTFWAKGAKASRRKKLPHLFSAGGFLTVSQQMKETLELLIWARHGLHPSTFYILIAKHLLKASFLISLSPNENLLSHPIHQLDMSQSCSTIRPTRVRFS